MIERPCTRCVKKGIGQQCTEGVRKKAKYLLEEDEKCMSTTTTRADKVVALEPQATATASSSSTSLLAQHARQHESVSISPHHSTHNQPDYSQFQQGVSNLPPSLQNQSQVRSDDIWLAPPLEGDNGIGLSGVDNRLWFGNSTGMNLDGMGGSTGESLLYLFFLILPLPPLFPNFIRSPTPTTPSSFLSASLWVLD